MKTEYLTYIFYFFVLILAWKFLQKFGVLDSAAERKQKKSSRSTLNPDTWKKTAKKTGKQPLSTTEVNDIAAILYESKGVFVDDESAAVAAIKRIKTKEQASFLAAYFAKKYKKDLTSYMNYLDDENKTLFFDYLNSLK